MQPEPGIVAELIRWLLGVPADRVTWAHLVVFTLGALVVSVPPIARVVWLVKHQRFLREATPEQLEAYQRDQTKPPGIGPFLGCLALVLTLGVLGREEARSEGRISKVAPSSVKDRCRPPCDPPSKCVGGSCQAGTRKPSTERAENDPVHKPVSELAEQRVVTSLGPYWED